MTQSTSSPSQTDQIYTVDQIRQALQNWTGQSDTNFRNMIRVLSLTLNEQSIQIPLAQALQQVQVRAQGATASAGGSSGMGYSSSSQSSGSQSGSSTPSGSTGSSSNR